MPGPLPVELRLRVVNAWLNNEGSYAVLAQRFGVGEASVDRWVARMRRTGDVLPEPMGGARRATVVDEAGEQIIRDFLNSVPDSTLPELCAHYEECTGVVVSPQTMSDTVRRLGFSKKKRSSDRRRPSAPSP